EKKGRARAGAGRLVMRLMAMRRLEPAQNVPGVVGGDLAFLVALGELGEGELAGHVRKAITGRPRRPEGPDERLPDHVLQRLFDLERVVAAGDDSSHRLQVERPGEDAQTGEDCAIAR